MMSSTGWENPSDFHLSNNFLTSPICSPVGYLLIDGGAFFER